MISLYAYAAAAVADAVELCRYQDPCFLWLSDVNITKVITDYILCDGSGLVENRLHKLLFFLSYGRSME